jgi:hypothetical protein
MPDVILSPRELIDLNDRIARNEGRFDVYEVRLQYLSRDAITTDHLDKRETKIMSAVDVKLDSVCKHIDTQNAGQSKDVLAKVEAMFTQQQIQFANDKIDMQTALLQANADTKKELLRYGIGFALTVLASLAVIWLSR